MLSGFLVTTAWGILRLRIEKAYRYEVFENMFNKHSRTVDKGCSSSLEILQWEGYKLHVMK
jgi:hypothetical protein